jgi:regulator of sigma E protease
MIGIRGGKIVMEDVNLFTAMVEATAQTYYMCKNTLIAVGQMITSQRSADQISGPIGIAKMSGQAASNDLGSILWFIAILSANLGLINLFPIPLLDGGHLMYYLIEMASGRPLAEKIQVIGFKVGAALLAVLMAFAVFNDIRKIF